MNKKKLLHIQLLPLLSGVQNMMLHLLSSLDKDKYDIYVICKPGGPLVDKIKEMGYTYLPVSSLRRELSLWDIVAFFKIFRICRKYKFDIVHTHSSKTGFLGRIAATLAGIPKVVHTVHGFAFHPFQNILIRHFYMFMEWFAARFCDQIVFVNNSEREFAIEKRIVPADKAITIYNGVELADNVKVNSHDQVNDSFVIGSVSRFSKQKNIVTLVKAAIRVCEKNEYIKFVLIGDGELLAECKAIVAEAKLKERIIFPGWQKNIDEWLQTFNVFALYSKWEGLPISILEAMAAGLPIIASDIKGNDELVFDNNGILVAVNDVDRLVNVLSSLPQQKESLIQWGRHSRQLVEEIFNMNKFVENYEKLYDN